MTLLRLRADLDSYHQRRADKHGYLYMLHRRSGFRLVEAKSIATGALCTFTVECVELASDEK